MKIRVSSAYVWFFSVVLLVAAVTFIEVTCPIDRGTGVITGAKGLRVTGIEAELVDYKILALGCGYDWQQFTYAVNISMVNETTTQSHGGIVVTFYNPEAAVTGIISGEEGGAVLEEYALELLGPPIERVPIFVEIPAETARTIERVIVFNGLFLYGETHTILVRMANEIVCPYSHGTGKVPITEWLMIKTNVQ